MNLTTPLPISTKDSLILHIKDGVFLTRRISFWRGMSEFICGEEQKLIFKPSKVLTSHDGDIQKLKFQIRRLFFFYTLQTRYGYFVPKQNLEPFWAKIEDIKQRHKNLCEGICEDYDLVSKELKRMYLEIARFKWMNDLRYPGDPPESFTESVVQKYMLANTKESISKRFRFDIFPTNPLLDCNNSAYGPREKIEELNLDVVKSVYKSIIRSRCTLLKIVSRYRDKINEGRRPYKSIATVCQLYKNCVFYDDKELLDRLSALRMSAMVSISRNPETVVSIIDGIIEYVVKNDSYLVGMIYERQV